MKADRAEVWTMESKRELSEARLGRPVATGLAHHTTGTWW